MRRRGAAATLWTKTREPDLMTETASSADTKRLIGAMLLSLTPGWRSSVAALGAPREPGSERAAAPPYRMSKASFAASASATATTTLRTRASPRRTARWAPSQAGELGRGHRERDPPDHRP